MTRKSRLLDRRHHHNGGAKESEKAGGMVATRNDLPRESREKLIGMLNHSLADLTDLLCQIKQAHWNVKGPSFIALHELFDKIHEDVEEYVDVIAERAVQLGGIAQGTVRIAARVSSLDEYPHLGPADEKAHVSAVADALAAMAKEMRQNIDTAGEWKDMDTADIYTEVSRGLDKWLWFVEAHLA